MKTMLKITLVVILTSITTTLCLSNNYFSDHLYSGYEEKLKEYIEYLEKQGFSGNIIIADKGEVILKKSIGFSDRENKITLNENSVFTVGSITKQFTAAGILKLEMQGKITTSDLITKYFDNIPENKKEITLHQLLTHSAGLPPFIGHDYDFISTDDFIKLAFEKELIFEPGKGYEYSNVGYSVLAIIIEKVSGLEYEKYLNQNLFKNAGMKYTGYFIPDWKNENFAIGYRNNERWGTIYERFKEKGLSWHLKGNGGILSTTLDMIKWHNALQGNNILSKEAKEKMYFPHVREGDSDIFYGYGYTIRHPYDDDKLVVKHNGGNTVFFADYMRFIDEDIVIYMCSNSADRKFADIAFNIADIIKIKDFTPKMIDYANIKTSKELPDNIKGKRAKDFFDLILNDSKNEDYKNYVTKNFSTSLIEKRGEQYLIDILKDLKPKFGEFTISKVEIQSESEYAVFIKPKDKGGFFIVTFMYDNEEQNKIKGLGLDREM